MTVKLTYKGLTTTHGKGLAAAVRESLKSTAASRRERRELAAAFRVATMKLWDSLPAKGKKGVPGRTSKEGFKLFLKALNTLPEARDIAIIAGALKSAINSARAELKEADESEKPEKERIVKDHTAALSAHKGAFEGIEFGGIKVSLRASGKGSATMVWTRAAAKRGATRTTASNGTTATASNGTTATASNGTTATASNGTTATASNGTTATASNGSRVDKERSDTDLGPVARMVSILDSLPTDTDRANALADLLVHCGGKVAEQAATAATHRLRTLEGAKRASGKG